MWNNIDYTCEKLNSIERFRIHKEHLERLMQAKSMIQNTPPIQPKFIYQRASKKEEKRNELSKISYENKILINRIDSIYRKPSPYSNYLLKPRVCPAFDRGNCSYIHKKKQQDLDKKNKFLYERFYQTKPYYSTKEFVKANKQIRHLQGIRKKNVVNPNLNYTTFEGFKKNFLREILKENNQNNKKKVICMNYNNFPRSNSCIRLTKRPESAVGYCSFGDFSSRDLNRTQRWFRIDRRDLSKNSRANSNEYDDLQ
jgi:hypothetical protein